MISQLRLTVLRLTCVQVFALLPSLTCADNPPLESILVTANAPSTQTSKQLGKVDILTAADIHLQQPPELHQLLNGIEGVYASREGGPGGINSVSIRGAEPNFTVVLIDGVAVNDPTNSRGGSYDLATLSPDHIRRVEVIKGPRSLEYGSDALAGVVKLITAPDNEDNTGLQVLHEAQEYGAFRSAGSATLAEGKHTLSIQGGRNDSGKVWTGSNRNLTEAAAHYRLTLDRALLQLGGRQADFTKRAYPEQSGGPMFAQNDGRDRSEGQDETFYVSGELSVVDGWRLATQYSQYQRELDYHSPGIAPYNNVPENFYSADYQRQQWRVVSDTRVAGFNLNVGADRRWETGVSHGAVVFPDIPIDALGFLLGLPSLPVETGLAIPLPLSLDTDYRLRRTTEGGFAELNWQSENSLVLSVGVRRDKTDARRETVRRYLVGIPLWQEARVNLSYSEGFKSPSFFALGHGLVGNPDLKPERAQSYQLDVSTQWQALAIELTLFDTDYRDLIDFDSEAFTNVNRDRVRSRGGELSVQTQWRNWRLHAGLAHAAVTVEDSDRNLANRPQNTATVDLGRQFAKRLGWHNRVRWTDEQFATSLHTGESREYVLDDYILWDTVLRWDATRTTSLTLGLENVADVRYQEAVGFPGAGRLLRFGLAITL